MKDMQSVRHILAEKSKSLIKTDKKKTIYDLIGEGGNRFNISDIDFNLLDEDLCLFAIEKVPFILGQMPDNLKTDKVIEVALKKDGSNILYVPIDRLRTEHLFAVAKSYPYFLRTAPKELFTQELINTVININKKDALRRLPEELITAEMCEKSVSEFPISIADVPEKLLSEKMCINAVVEDPCLIERIPKALRTTSVYAEMCKRGGVTAPKYLPVGADNQAFVAMAVNADSEAIRSVLPSDMSQEIANLAFSKDLSSFRHIPNAFKTPEMCKLVARQDSSVTFTIPKALLTHELLLDALKGQIERGNKSEQIEYSAHFYFLQAKDDIRCSAQEADEFTVALLKQCPAFFKNLPTYAIAGRDLVLIHLAENFDELMGLLPSDKAAEVAALFTQEETQVEVPHG